MWLLSRKPTVLAFEKILQNVWKKYCIDSFISNQACSRKQRPYANAFSLYAAKFFFWSVCHWSNFELSTDDQHWNGCSRHHCFAQYRVMLFTFYSITIMFFIFSCTDKGALVLMNIKIMTYWVKIFCQRSLLTRISQRIKKTMTAQFEQVFVTCGHYWFEHKARLFWSCLVIGGVVIIFPKSGQNHKLKVV